MWIIHNMPSEHFCAHAGVSPVGMDPAPPPRSLSWGKPRSGVPLQYFTRCHKGVSLFQNIALTSKLQERRLTIAESRPSFTVFSMVEATMATRSRTSWFRLIPLNYLIRKNIMGNGDLKQSHNQANFIQVLLEDVATRHFVQCLHFQNDKTRGQNKWN